MKSLLVLLAVLVAMFAAFDTARAEREVSLQDGALIVKESTLVMRVPNVPKGLSANNAYNLVTGWSKEAVIKDWPEETKFSFSFPLIRMSSSYTNKKITFRGGEWLTNPVADKISKSSDELNKFLTVLTLILPALFIAIVSIQSSLSGAGRRKLLFLYFMMFSGILAALLSRSLGSLPGVVGSGFLVGTVVGMMAGAIAALIATAMMSTFGGFFGLLAGMLVGGFAGALADTQNYDLLVQYCVFLLVVMIISFLLAQAIGRAKKKRLTGSESL